MHSKRAGNSFHPIEGAIELEMGLGGAQACENLSAGMPQACFAF